MSNTREQVRRVRIARQMVVEEALVVIARGLGTAELQEALDIYIRESRRLEEIAE